jgi:hypothetical protein
LLEETNESLWTAKKFLDNFYSCFGKFRSFIDSGFLPNYFIPKQNMFESHASPTLLFVELNGSNINYEQSGLACSSQSYILYVPESTASQLMYLILVIMEEKKRTASVRATF